jgi:tRNA threonylcarbamoyladenosine biosynthesis protein TsaB
VSQAVLQRFGIAHSGITIAGMNRIALLALDTSTEFCSVALGVASDDGTPAFAAVHVRHEQTGSVSSARLLPAVTEVLAEAGMTLGECSAIAFGAGPGSFTGLRTATGAAQGLAFGSRLPVVPVSTLMACAEAARVRDAAADRVLVAMDARMDEAYWALYEWSVSAGDWRVVSAPALSGPGAIAVPELPFTLAGNAHAAFGERLIAAAQARVIDGAALPHAGPVAVLALRALRRGETVDAAHAAPEYIRDKVAQTTAEREAARAEST